MTLKDVLKLIDGYLTETFISKEWRDALNICKALIEEKLAGGSEIDIKNLNPYIVTFMYKVIDLSTEIHGVYYLPFKLNTVDNIKMFTEDLKSRLKVDDLVIVNIKDL